MFVWRLAWREFTGDKFLWGLSAVSVAIGVAVLIGALAGLLTAQGMLRHRRLVDELQAEGH